MKNHRTSLYVRKQRMYTTEDNKYLKKDANGNKLH